MLRVPAIFINFPFKENTRSAHTAPRFRSLYFQNKHTRNIAPQAILRCNELPQHRMNMPAVEQAWATVEHSNGLLTELLASPERWESELEEAEQVCAKAKARLEASLPRSTAWHPASTKERVSWLKAFEIATIVPINFERAFRGPEQPSRAETGTATTLAFERKAESVVEIVFAENGTYILRTMSGHVIEKLKGGIDFEFIPPRPGASQSPTPANDT